MKIYSHKSAGGRELSLHAIYPEDERGYLVQVRNGSDVLYRRLTREDLVGLRDAIDAELNRVSRN